MQSFWTCGVEAVNSAWGWWNVMMYLFSVKLENKRWNWKYTSLCMDMDVLLFNEWGFVSKVVWPTGSSGSQLIYSLLVMSGDPEGEKPLASVWVGAAQNGKSPNLVYFPLWWKKQQSREKKTNSCDWRLFSVVENIPAWKKKKGPVDANESQFQTWSGSLSPKHIHTQKGNSK